MPQRIVIKGNLACFVSAANHAQVISDGFDCVYRGFSGPVYCPDRMGNFDHAFWFKRDESAARQTGIVFSAKNRRRRTLLAT